MSLLRIYSATQQMSDTPARYQWSLLSEHLQESGAASLADLSKRATLSGTRVQLVLPATQVLLTRTQLPQTARHHSASLLTYAVEEQTAGDPDANQVTWLGSTGDQDALAVMSKILLTHWRETFAAIGIHDYDIHCETLFLPLKKNEWSLAWNGHEGFVRSGKYEGAATDCGDEQQPPLSLCMMLETAAIAGTSPIAIALHMTPDTTTSDTTTPDTTAWTRALGVDVYVASSTDWRTAPADTGISLMLQRQRWRALSGVSTRLRPAMWMLGAALSIHAVALVVDWTSLAQEKRAIHQQMEMRFRSVFPAAVAVSDPALQMRRKLAEARAAVGQPDNGDFLPMIKQIANATKELPAGTLSALSYESGRMTLEFLAIDTANLQRITARLLEVGMTVDTVPTTPVAGNNKTILTVQCL